MWNLAAKLTPQLWDNPNMLYHFVRLDWEWWAMTLGTDLSHGFCKIPKKLQNFSPFIWMGKHPKKKAPTQVTVGPYRLAVLHLNFIRVTRLWTEIHSGSGGLMIFSSTSSSELPRRWRSPAFHEQSRTSPQKFISQTDRAVEEEDQGQWITLLRGAALHFALSHYNYAYYWKAVHSKAQAAWELSISSPLTSFDFPFVYTTATLSPQPP